LKYCPVLEVIISFFILLSKNNLKIPHLPECYAWDRAYWEIGNGNKNGKIEHAEILTAACNFKNLIH